MIEKKHIKRVAIVLGAIVLFFLFFNVRSIDAGERGILYITFSGAISEEVKGPGVHVYFSWYDLFVYDLRIAETKHTMSVLSKNGLDIQIELSVRYQPLEDKLTYIFTNIGRDQTAYYEKIIMPEIRSVTREVLGKFEEEEIYNTKREQVQADIFKLMKTRLGKHGITCETVLVRDINLPTEIQTAIKTKLKEQQLALQYDYRLLRE
jgi:regulator of protease activity HflC (stomatin/prohibitin superfamily)